MRNDIGKESDTVWDVAVADMDEIDRQIDKKLPELRRLLRKYEKTAENNEVSSRTLRRKLKEVLNWISARF